MHFYAGPQYGIKFLYVKKFQKLFGKWYIIPTNQQKVKSEDFTLWCEKLKNESLRLVRRCGT